MQDRVRETSGVATDDGRRHGADDGPAPGGIGRALWSLITPFGFEPAHPVERALRYSERRGRRAPLADVYLPESPRGSSVVMVHGGGFVIGSRRMKPMRYLATRLVQAGIAAVPFDYRLIFRGGRLDEALEDVGAALAWWRRRAPDFGLDPDRINVLGVSAGATLALLAAAARAPGEIHRLVSIFGVYDFTYLGGKMGGLLRSLLLRSRDRDVWRQRSPVVAGLSAAPSLLLHGEADVMVPLEHAHRLATRRRERGLPTELVTYPGERHAFLNDCRRPVAERAVADIVGFLNA